MDIGELCKHYQSAIEFIEIGVASIMLSGSATFCGLALYGYYKRQRNHKDYEIPPASLKNGGEI